jgi:hypothetical protein
MLLTHKLVALYIGRPHVAPSDDFIGFGTFSLLCLLAGRLIRGRWQSRSQCPAQFPHPGGDARAQRKIVDEAVKFHHGVVLEVMCDYLEVTQ